MAVPFLCTVLTSIPNLGIALVCKTKTTPSLTDVLVARLPYDDGSNGAHPKEAIAPYTSVMCVGDESSSHKCYIVGVANDVPKNLQEGNADFSLYAMDDFTSTDIRSILEIISSMFSLIVPMLSNNGSNSDRDILPGDYDIIDKQGLAGIHIGRYIAQLRGSPLCFIDASNISNTIRIVAPNIQNHTITTESILSNGYEIHNIAINGSEAFGHSNTKVVELQEDPSFNNMFSGVSQSAIPFYRFQNIKGGLIGGKEDLVISYIDSQFVHNRFNEPYTIAKDRLSLDGSRSIISAYQFRSIKSPFINSVVQNGYNKEINTESNQFIDENRVAYKYEELEPNSNNVSFNIDDTALYLGYNSISRNEYIKIYSELWAYEGLGVTSKDHTLGSSFTTQPQVGPVSTSQYPLPPYIELTDPITKEKKKYYNSESFISQEADGSILIKDGYGSEIRMSRGNIYISPSLDLFIRPGRDLSCMVPRYSTINTQDHLTLNTNKSIYIRAMEDCKIVCGTSELGNLLLQCNGNKQVDGMPNGVIIKSSNDVSISGQGSIYVLRNNNDGKEKDITDSPQQGYIIIDGGTNGSIINKSYFYLVDSPTYIVCATNEESTSAFTVSKNNIGLYTLNIIAPATISQAKLKTGLFIKSFKNGALTDIRVNTGDNNDLICYGNLLVKDNCIVNGNARINSGILANGVQSTSSSNSVVSESMKETVFKPYVIQDVNITTLDSAYFSTCIKNATMLSYKNEYFSKLKFYFPDYNIGTLSVPGMSWQADAIDIGLSEYWIENYILDDEDNYTACYPGYKAWENSTVSYRNNETKPLKNGYYINV